MRKRPAMSETDLKNAIAAAVCPTCEIAMERILAKPTLHGNRCETHRCPQCGYYKNVILRKQEPPR